MFSNKINLSIFTPASLPADLVHRLLFNGFSIYEGIIIVWDKNQDHNVIKIIDNLPDEIKEILLLISENNRKLTLYWATVPTDEYLIGEKIKIGKESWIIELTAMMV